MSGNLTLISTGTNGIGNDYSEYSSISADGTKVAFYSTASNLVAGDTNAGFDVLVKDLATGTLTRVNTGTNEGRDVSYAPSISANGAKVAFDETCARMCGRA